MTAKVRQKSELVIPGEFIRQLGFAEGDEFDMYVEEGIIHLMPVVEYPKECIERWEKEAEETMRDFVDGKIKAYSNIEELMASLENDDDEAINHPAPSKKRVMFC